MSNDALPIDPRYLPATVRRYLDAHRNNDPDTAITSFTDSAVVVDDGKTYDGIEQIRDWLSQSATAFTYTVELTAAGRIDEQHYEAINHLEGNFPGGVVDLRYQFVLDEAERISHLVIGA